MAVFIGQKNVNVLCGLTRVIFIKVFNFVYLFFFYDVFLTFLIKLL